MTTPADTDLVWARLERPRWGEIAVASSPVGLRVMRFGAPDAGPAGDPHGAIPALERYLDGDLTALDALPLDAPGTDFQRLCWDALRRIPVGTTTTYGALAVTIDRPDAVRAVGTANGANPLAIVVPCHRVIGQDGKLVGYAGGLPRKRALLAHEGAPGFLVP